MGKRGATLLAIGAAGVSGVAVASCGSSGERQDIKPVRPAGVLTATNSLPVPPPIAAPTTPATAPQPHARRYRSVSQALQAIRDHVDVPVVMPTNLPAHTKLAADPILSRDIGQLSLEVAPGSVLTILYGKVGFDGCGPLHPHQVTVGGQPAVIESHRSHGQFTELIWPATLKHLQGRYGLSGQFDKQQILRWANSMQHAEAAALRPLNPGC